MYFRTLFLAACTAAAVLAVRPHGIGHQATCNPLGRGTGEDCFLPFPSSFYTRADPTTSTGIRIDLTHARLPRSVFGADLDPTPFNHRDGFSPVSPLLAQFPAIIDGSNLPDVNHPEKSLLPGSSVQLWNYESGRRVPIFAELDHNTEGADDPQALIIQPFSRLRTRTRYVVVIQDLKDRKGLPVQPLSGFKALRDRGAEGAAGEIFAFLERKGLERSRLQLAWDFQTASEGNTSGRLIGMRDQALSTLELASQAKPFAIEHDEENPKSAPGIYRRLRGTFRAPNFLNAAGDRLNVGPDGEPLMNGVADFPVVIHIPECAKSAASPLPVVLYGHGTFNSAENEMATPYSAEILNRLCMIEVGTDWLGRARSDLSYFLLKVLPNWNNFQQITDRLQQAQLNFVVLARLIRQGALKHLPGLSGHVIDSSRIYYYGISEGGCQGVTALALSPDIARGALNVPCGFWGMFFWRSSDFHYTRWALRATYPGALERQKLLALSQLLWDYTDPANFGGHLLAHPLSGNTVKPLLYQEGINDASVPNLTTRAMARTIGLDLLGPGVEPVYGIQTRKGPLDSAYVQFDVGSRPRLGGDNVPPGKSPVHEEIRRLEAAKEQLARFLRPGGKVEDTCEGQPCLFNVSAQSVSNAAAPPRSTGSE